MHKVEDLIVNVDPWRNPEITQSAKHLSQPAIIKTSTSRLGLELP
jgi:hypothetical protein